MAFFRVISPFHPGLANEALLVYTCEVPIYYAMKGLHSNDLDFNPLISPLAIFFVFQAIHACFLVMPV